MRLNGWSVSLTLKAKVSLLVVLALIAAVAPAALALWVADRFKRTIDTIHKDTIVPLENLHRVEEFLREVELRIPGVMTDLFSGPGAKAYIDSALPHVADLWSETRSRAHEGRSATLVKDFDEAFGRFQAFVPRLADALGKEDKQRLPAIADEWLDLKPKLFKPLGALVTAARDDVAREVKTADDRLRRATWLIAVGLGAFVAVILAVSVGLLRGITIPLRHTVRLLKDLARDLVHGQGDLTTRLDTRRRDEIGELSRSFNTFMDTLHDIASQVKRTAAHLTSASQQLASASEELSSASQEHAAGLEETAAHLEEITGTVRQTADNARQANQLALGSQDTAQTGREVVASAVASMEETTQASKRIVEIIAVIDEIAFQTNLLALNAAVEAARAGDQGRGFAVVAAEVRNLAQRSAVAAKQIKALIQDSVAKVEGGSALVSRSGQTLEAIVVSVKQVTNVIAEIAAASQDQSRGIDQLNLTVTQMDQVVQQNAAQTEELSSTAQALAGQAEQLEAVVGRFKLDDSATAQGPAAAGRPLTSLARPAVRAGVASARPKGPEPWVAVPAGRRVAVGAGDGFDEF